MGYSCRTTTNGGTNFGRDKAQGYIDACVSIGEWTFRGLISNQVCK
ncbi:hypothetical protein AAZX31_12G145100 [Glycine max]